jgi:hypothetical protein
MYFFLFIFFLTLFFIINLLLLQLIFGPTAKVCVSSGKRLTDEVILQKAREYCTTREEILKTRDTIKKTAIVSIKRAKVNRNGKVIYYTEW